MVVIFLPLDTELSGTWQERVATPSIWTVQAPHWAMPQPYLVPVRPSVSRSTQSSGVRGSALACSDLPLTLSTAMAGLLRQSVVPNGGKPYRTQPRAAKRHAGYVRHRVVSARWTSRHGNGKCGGNEYTAR